MSPLGTLETRRRARRPSAASSARTRWPPRRSSGSGSAREGFDVTQATLSRDLAQLGAVRVSLPEGGTVYGLETAPPPSSEDRLRELGSSSSRWRTTSSWW